MLNFGGVVMCQQSSFTNTCQMGEFFLIFLFLPEERFTFMVFQDDVAPLEQASHENFP